MVINNYNANRGDFGKDRMRLYLKKKKRAETIGFKSWKGNKVFDRVYWKLFFPSPITPKPYQRRNNTHIWRVPETKSILLLELPHIKKQREHYGGRYSLFFSFQLKSYPISDRKRRYKNKKSFSMFLYHFTCIFTPRKLLFSYVWRKNTHIRALHWTKIRIFAKADRRNGQRYRKRFLLYPKIKVWTILVLRRMRTM